MLYEMVSGRRAFKGDSAIETLSAILKHDPPELSATDAAISPPLASVVQHCLEKEPNQRFQSARDLAFALARLSGPSTSGPVAQLPAAAVAAKIVDNRICGRACSCSSPPAPRRTCGALAVVACQPTFRQLTFRRGHIDTARFAPDGQTVISSASWDGKPFEMPRPGSTPPNLRRCRCRGRRSICFALRRSRRDREGRYPRAACRLAAAGRVTARQVRDADWAPDGDAGGDSLEGRRDVGRVPARQVHLRTNRTSHQRRSGVSRRRARSP